MQKITNILEKYGIKKENTFLYGDYIAKINPIYDTPNKEHKLILVTAVSPTPAGEGKTTTTIGLTESLNAIGKKTIAALREPSMGPVFGVKGGANGGGKSQIVPKDEINFHFTGDIHAITAANNLISACIDNNIYWGNSLNIDINKIVWKRVLDINDRSLREVEITINPKKNIKYKTGFDITVASELMAIFCLAKNEQDLKERVENIIVAYSLQDTPIYVKDLNISGAIIKILQDAIKPNVVQTLEGNLAIVHGGPFANIAHGCNSILATNTAMNLAEYTVTEAGFGSDLGAEKFLDIVCDQIKKVPNCVVLVASTRSLKMHGGISKENLKEENLEALKLGLENLHQHIKNIQSFNLPLIVSLTQLDISLKQELELVASWLKDNKIKYCFNDTFSLGSKGGEELAKMVVENCKDNSNAFSPVYNKTEDLKSKIEKICTRCYGATGAEYSKEVEEKIKQFNNLPYYVCMAKTPISLTDNEKILVIKEPFKIHVKDLLISNGAQFIVVLTGNIFRMPGLPKIPEACNM